MKKKVNKKVTVKKAVSKKIVKAKKPATKKPVAEDPLNSKSAIADLRKQYTTLAKLNVQRAIVLEAISKKEAELAEVLDLNMAKVEDRSNEELLKKLSKPEPKPDTNLTNLGVTTVSAPFCGTLSPTLGAPDCLNAIARKY